MTKAELAGRVADKIHLTKKQTEAIVNILFTCITDALKEGDKVELRGFGSFRTRSRNAREGAQSQNWRYGPNPLQEGAFFKAGKELREVVDR